MVARTWNVHGWLLYAATCRLPVLVQNGRQQNPAGRRAHVLDHYATLVQGTCGNGRQLLRPLQQTVSNTNKQVLKPVSRSRN